MKEEQKLQLIQQFQKVIEGYTQSKPVAQIVREAGIRGSLSIFLNSYAPLSIQMEAVRRCIAEGEDSIFLIAFHKQGLVIARAMAVAITEDHNYREVMRAEYHYNNNWKDRFRPWDNNRGMFAFANNATHPILYPNKLEVLTHDKDSVSVVDER